MLSPSISFREILIHMTSLFLEDFDRYYFSETCSIMNKILKRENFHLFIEIEEQNIPWDSHQVGKRWINVKNYGTKFKDEKETMQFFYGWMEKEQIFGGEILLSWIMSIN